MVGASIRLNYDRVKEIAGTVSFQPGADLITPLWQEMEAILDGGGHEGYFSASIAIATKRMN